MKNGTSCNDKSTSNGTSKTNNSPDSSPYKTIITEDGTKVTIPTSIIITGYL